MRPPWPRPVRPHGLPLVDRIRRALQYADSIDRAVRILQEGNNGLYTNEWLLADTKTGEVAMFELGTHKITALAQQPERVVRRAPKGSTGAATTPRTWKCGSRPCPASSGRPANVVFHPSDRDRTWLQLFDQKKGNERRFRHPGLHHARRWPPSHSLDAKFTTTALARNLTTWAMFGPPLGHAWEPTDSQKQQFPAMAPLIGNDWTLLRVQPPSPGQTETKPALDLARMTS